MDSKAAARRLLAGDDACEARWFDSLDGVALAFDHGDLLARLSPLPAPLR